MQTQTAANIVTWLWLQDVLWRCIILRLVMIQFSINSSFFFSNISSFNISYKHSFSFWLSFMCEFEKALQNLFLGKYQIDFPLLTNGILARLLQMSEHLTVSVRARVLWENVPLWFPEQPRFFWHRCVTLHGPFPSPCSAAHAGSECSTEWFYWRVELVPSPPVPSV